MIIHILNDQKKSNLKINLHRQFGKTLFGSSGSLEAPVIDMLMFDSKTTRSKSELRFCSWTVSNWESAVLLLYFCLKFISYDSLHYKYFCIKCFCYFELRKAQKYIYCQQHRQFNRFQNCACCVEWSKYRCFHYLIKHFWRFKLHWWHDNCAQLQRFSWLYYINFNHSQQYNK